MSRGDIVTVALQGDFGKPRPAVILQSSAFREHPTLTVLPMTSEIVDIPILRINVEPSIENGLQKRSQIMVDKVQTIARHKVRPASGRLSDSELLEVNRALATFLGFA